MKMKGLIPRKRHEDVALSPFAAMQQQMNQMFSDFWNDWPNTAMQPVNFMPRMETSETSKQVTVSAELPGMGKDDIKIVLSPDAEHLTLSGEKRFEEESKDEESNYYHLERSYGSFHRTIPLPCPVDPERIKAKFKDGVLKIKLDKKPTESTPGTRQIQIEA
jgi:HSP20 family protein